MYFKKITFSTQCLYQISKLLSVRKLYILGVILKKHKTLSYNPSMERKRRARRFDVVAIPKVRTEFARAQLEYRSSQIYNKVNEELKIYKKSLPECKSITKSWLQNIDYDKIETLIT